MAIKASGQITLTSVVDVKATYRYYLLQASTVSKPNKPTTYPPAATWDDTEPTYTNGSTNSLYIVDCTVFSNDTFQYSEVSLSSSYEAAKEAYNKAVAAQGTANTAMQHTVVQSTTQPTVTTYLWLDMNLEPPVLRRYNSDTGEWDIINDTTALDESIVYLEEHIYSEITKTEENVLSTVGEKYYLQEEAEKLVASVETQFKQTAEDFTFQFNTFSADLAALSEGTDAEFEKISKYIRFLDGKIYLGEVGNQLELQIANDRISFFQGGAEVAYFSNNKLYVVDGEFTNSLRLGNFSFIPRSNGNLSFKKNS